MKVSSAFYLSILVSSSARRGTAAAIPLPQPPPHFLPQKVVRKRAGDMFAVARTCIWDNHPLLLDVPVQWLLGGPFTRNKRYSGGV